MSNDVVGGEAAAGGRGLGLTGRLALLTTLYLSQGLPYGFFTQTLPVLLRQQGTSLPEIGLTSLLALPWGLKFLWAPWLDRRELRVFGVGLAGLRRSWIVPLQALSALALAAAAFVDPTVGMPAVLGIVLLINFLASTQDIATDGYAVELLREPERGLGNGVQVAGYRVGMVLGGGFLVVVFERLGWQASFLSMAVVLALVTLPVLLVPEEERPAAPGGSTSWGSAFVDLWRRPGVPLWLLLLVLYKAGDAFAAGMLRPFLVDIGRPMEAVGWMIGLGGFFTGLVGALVGGWLADRAGRIPALFGCGAFQVVAVALYLVPALAPGIDDTFLAFFIGLDHLAGGMATAVLFTMMMDRASPLRAGTDYTVQASVVVVATGLASTLAGVSAQALGHAGHFGLGSAVAGLGLLVVVGVLRARPDLARVSGADPAAG